MANFQSFKRGLLKTTVPKPGSSKASATRGAKRRDARTRRSAPRARTSSSAHWLALIGLSLITLAAYNGVSGNDFVNLDDQAYVVENAQVRQGLTWQTIRWAFSSLEQGNWHPLTWISHALDCQVYGLAPAGHHITSLIFHLLNVLLLFWLLWRATGMVGRSFLAAALFAAHPFNVESVAWIAERKNVLSTLFFLLTLGAYGWYARKPGWKRYAVVGLLFAAGLAAKPMLVTLPFVLLLLDYWPLRRIAGWGEASQAFPIPRLPASQLALEKLPLLLLSAASSVVTVIAQAGGGAVASLQIIPYDARVENALRSYALYLWKAIWPLGLAAYYPSPLDPAYGPEGKTAGMFGVAVLSGLMIASASVAVWRLRREQRYAATGWLWFLGTLVPVIGIVQVGTQAMADRYAYIPIIGLCVLLCGVWRTWQKSGRSVRG